MVLWLVKGTSDQPLKGTASFLAKVTVLSMAATILGLLGRTWTERFNPMSPSAAAAAADLRRGADRRQRRDAPSLVCALVPDGGEQ
jgi:hypothetical protein